MIALKLLATDDVRRPQDSIDLAALFAIASADDLRTAEAAVATITQRGANRGRDLLAMLRDHSGRKHP
ncbi:MAG: hypothetical protein JNK15_22975 [Planctomycetes bacterium]|nr:hypothetical protein [Planctomycetota bacterium]